MGSTTPGQESVEVAVIGAGIVGAACAHELADAGLHVAVLEREAVPAACSTGLSAAGVRVQWTDPVNVALSRYSIEVLRGFSVEFGVDSGYRPVGYLLLVPEADWEAHLAGVEVQRAAGAPVQVLTLDAARQRFAPFDPTGLAGATFGPIDGVVDPHAITLAYLRRARERRAQLRFRAEVTRIERGADDWVLHAGGLELRARVVVNAAGAWAGRVGAMAGISVPVEPARRMIWSTAARPGRAVTPLTVDLASGVYFRSEGERLLLGRSNPDEQPGFVTGIDWDFLEPTLACTIARFPWFAQEQLDAQASWYGYYELTPDHNGIIGASPAAPGWVDAAGFSGHGVQQAPAVGRAVREEIVDGRAHSIDIDPLRVGRFAAGAHRHDRHVV